MDMGIIMEGIMVQNNIMKAVIFDLDGVICFTDKYHYQAWKKLADKEGIYFDETINNRLRGVSRMASLDIILEKANRTYSQEEKEQMAQQKNDAYVKLLENMSPSDLSEEVKNTLDELRNRGYKLAIGSSSKNTKRILKQIGLGNYFDAISDGTNITNSKPDPEVFLKAAEMIGEKPKDCLVVEDALSGIEAAYRGGFKSAGIGEASTHAHVTYPIVSFSDLKKICE
jgi:beta-phosphoglucomutase